MSYIAKEPLVSAIEETISKSCNVDRVSEFAKGFNSALFILLGVLRQLPDPDVVPKSEVTKLRENEAKWQEMYAESQSKWEEAYGKCEAKTAEEIFKWVDENAVNLNFLTGNFEINFAQYIEFKKNFIGEEQK